MKKKFIFAIGAVTAGVVVLFLAYRSIFDGRTVTVSRVESGNLVMVVYATGNVTADSSATLRSELGGIVTYIGAREGMYVKRGEIILRTDDNDDLLKVEQASAGVQSAKVDLQTKMQDLQRTEALFESKSVTQKSLDDARSEVDLAKLTLQQNQIALDIAKQRLAKTEITAPFSGVIISATAKLGDYLLPNEVCFQMIAPSSILVAADVDEQDFSRVSKGQKCVVAFDAYGSEKFDGYVYRIVPKTDEATKTSKVFVRLTNPPANLNVGMTATVNIITSELRNVILVPRSAVMRLQDCDIVYAVENGRAKIVRVKLGSTDGKYSEILNGELSPGVEIISQPDASFHDGMRVGTGQ